MKNVGEENRWAAHFTGSNPINHKFVLRFDFNLTNPNVNNSIKLHIDNETIGEGLYYEYGRNIDFITLGKNLKVGGSIIEGVSLLPDTWYRLELVMDPQKSKADVYLNNDLKKRGVRLGTFNTLCGFVFMGPLDSGDYYIDNIRVYKNDSIMNEDEYQAALNLWRSSPLGFNDEYNMARNRQYDEILWYTIYGRV